MGKISSRSTGSRPSSIANPLILHKPHLQSELNKLLDASISQNTHRAYNAGVQAYHKFCSESQIPECWPPNLPALVQFLLHLSFKGLAYSTARSYIAALSYQCKLQGVYDPTSEFLVCKLLQGMKRLRHTADSRLPITKTILAGILRVLPCICRNDYECALFSAVFSLAFHGLFRVGELVSHRTSPTRVLQRGDVQLDRANGSLNINIVCSKNV